jgi:hypothetical protein
LASGLIESISASLLTYYTFAVMSSAISCCLDEVRKRLIARRLAFVDRCYLLASERIMERTRMMENAATTI